MTTSMKKKKNTNTNGRNTMRRMGPQDLLIKNYKYKEEEENWAPQKKSFAFKLSHQFKFPSKNVMKKYPQDT